MKNESMKDLMTFFKIAILCVLACLLAAYLQKSGHEWLAGRFFVTFAVAMMWWMLIRGIREGHLRPFGKGENPRGFACVKYVGIVANSLASVGVAWLWFN